MISIQLILILLGVIVVLIVILASYAELQKGRKKCKIRIPLPKTWVRIDGPRLSGPLFVYNSKKVKAKDVMRVQEVGDKNNYLKGCLTEHLISKIDRHWKRAVRFMKHSRHSCVPIHNLYKGVESAGKTYGSVNPMSGEGDGCWKVLIHRNDAKLDGFIADGCAYFV